MQDLPVILRTHEVYNSIVRLTDKLPATRRQTLGRRLEDSTLELLEFLIMAKNAPKPHKAVYLIKAGAIAEILQFHTRTLIEQKLANITTLHQLQAKITEISKMIAGWRKSVQ